MSNFFFEGTMDFIVATPALIANFVASGSILAGQGLAWSVQNDSAVYVPSAVPVGTVKCAGVALQSGSTGNVIPVLVWGYAKNLTLLGTMVAGNWLALSGSSGGFASLPTGSFLLSPQTYAGTCVSGSGKTLAFVDCM